MLFRTPWKKLQISWALLKTVSFLFWVNFRPKVNMVSLKTCFQKQKIYLHYSCQLELFCKKGVRGGFRTLQTSKMEFDAFIIE